MGQRPVALGWGDPELAIIAAIDSPDNRHLGEDVGTIAGIGPIGVLLADRLAVSPHVVIDFSVPTAAEAITRTCVDRKLPLVVATTGFNESQQQMLREAA